MHLHKMDRYREAEKNESVGELVDEKEGDGNN